MKEKKANSWSSNISEEKMEVSISHAAITNDNRTLGSECKLKFRTSKYDTKRKGWTVIRGTLPQPMISAIENRFEKPIEAHRAIRCLVVLFNKWLMEGNELDTIIEVGDAYKNFIFYGNRDYHKLLTIIVKELKILKKKSLPNGKLFDKGQVTRYVFNPEFILDHDLKVFYYERRTQGSNRVVDTDDIKDALSDIKQGVIDSLDKITLSISEQEIDKIIDKRKKELYNHIYENTSKNKDGHILYKTKKGVKTYKKHYKSREHFAKEKAKNVAHRHMIFLRRFLPENKNPHNIIIDNKAGRWYHDVTNVPSDYLQYLRLDGEPLVEIDLRNSQFTIFSNMIDCYEFRTTSTYEYYSCFANELLSSLKDEESSNITFYKEDNIFISTYLSSHFLPYTNNINYKRKNSSKEVDDWNRAAFNGKLYEHVCSVIHPQVPVNKQIRGSIKAALFQIWFGDYRFSVNSDSNRELWKSFPDVITIIQGIKSAITTSLLTFSESEKPEDQKILDIISEKINDPAKAASNLFCIGHQRIEVLIFIYSILPSLFHHGILALPKHDSILCKQSDKDKVVEIMQLVLDCIFQEDKYKLNIKRV